MPFAVTKLPNEPIIIAQYELGDVNGEDSLRSVQQQIARTATENPSPLYVLTDFRHQEIQYSDILLMIESAQRSPEGGLPDRRLRMALVGEHPLLAIAARKFDQAFGTSPRCFITLDDALAWARAEISRQSPPGDT